MRNCQKSYKEVSLLMKLFDVDISKSTVKHFEQTGSIKNREIR